MREDEEWTKEKIEHQIDHYFEYGFDKDVHHPRVYISIVEYLMDVIDQINEEQSCEYDY